MTDHATWVSFTNEELQALRDILANGVSYLDPNRQLILDRLNQYDSPAAKDQDYRDAAEELGWVRDGECEIDDHAVVSASDEGAYVMAWVWVDCPYATGGTNIPHPDAPSEACPRTTP